MKKLFLLLSIVSPLARAQVAFTNVDSVFAYAQRNSSSSKTSTQQSLLAKWTYITSLANTVNFRNPVTFTPTNNLMLPVSFIPASAFGGPAGSLKQITLGQQYVSNFNYNPQIDIINPANWARVKSASLNKELTETNNLLIKKTLFESIAAAYYNIVSLQEQEKTTKLTLASADSLLLISQNKFSLGLIREQDVNNTAVNQLNVKDKLVQVQASIEQQYNSLKILCDIPANTKVTVSSSSDNISYNAELKATSSLQLKNAILQSEFARSELRANRWSTLPVVSAIYYQGWQQNSNSSFFDSKSAWIQSQYIGLKISVPIPPDANRLSQNYTSKINYRTALINAEHAKLQNELSNQSLNLDYEKAYSSYLTSKNIYELKERNYQKSLNQYKEGILSTDVMLNAFVDLLNSRLALISAQASLEFAKTKININNLSQ
ncbi:MAG TPA: TolC family protein [Bacteroidia bacterium]|jgi:outer membrane protein|nr:TolC family protein [Bacteroidia bacterium]